jgi:hypothetical protein
MKKVNYSDLVIGSKYNIEITYPTSKNYQKFIGVFAELLVNNIVGVRPRFRDVQMFWPKAKGNKWKQSSSNTLNTIALPSATITCYSSVCKQLKDKIKLYDENTKKLQIRYMNHLFLDNQIYFDNSLAFQYIWPYFLDTRELQRYKHKKYQHDLITSLLHCKNVFFDDYTIELLFDPYLENC